MRNPLNQDQPNQLPETTIEAPDLDTWRWMATPTRLPRGRIQLPDLRNRNRRCDNCFGMDLRPRSASSNVGEHESGLAQ